MFKMDGTYFGISGKRRLIAIHWYGRQISGHTTFILENPGGVATTPLRHEGRVAKIPQEDKG